MGKLASGTTPPIIYFVNTNQNKGVYDADKVQLSFEGKQGVLLGYDSAGSITCMSYRDTLFGTRQNETDAYQFSSTTDNPIFGAAAADPSNHYGNFIKRTTDIPSYFLTTDAKFYAN